MPGVILISPRLHPSGRLPLAQTGAPLHARVVATTRVGTGIDRTRDGMVARLGPEGLRAAGMVWLVVNAVNLLQSVGFATRPVAPELNPILGLAIAALAIPATSAVLVFRRRRAGWLFLVGPLVFDLFVVLMVVVDYLSRIEWRDPVVPVIEVPYLLLFFGSIVLMGLPMYRLDRRRWLVTVATSAILIGSMAYALSAGVG